MWLIGCTSQRRLVGLECEIACVIDHCHWFKVDLRAFQWMWPSKKPIPKLTSREMQNNVMLVEVALKVDRVHAT